MTNRLTRSVLLLCALASPSLAQGTRVPFGTEGHDSSQRVEISADNLDLDQATGTALFTGNVHVAQGELRIAAATIKVFYAESDSERGGESGGRISRLEASGDVTLTNGEEAAESQEATYDVGSGLVMMEGDVLLTQGPNALSSERLRIDLNSGNGTFEGRVRTVFNPEAAP
jgi:lipopolysaccharide export system protein LptA